MRSVPVLVYAAGMFFASHRVYPKVTEFIGKIEIIPDKIKTKNIV